MGPHVIIYFGLVLGAFSAPGSAAQPRILNGREPFRPFPFIVSIQTVMNPPNFEHWCTGTLIQKDRVLTAFHCFVNATETSPWRVLAGSADASSESAPTINFTKEDVVFDSENFEESTRASDLAIIKLPDGFSLGDPSGIQVANLSYDPVPLFWTPSTSKQTLVEVAGWGETQCGQFASTLKQAYGRSIFYSGCKTPYEDRGWFGHIHEEYTICALFKGGGQGAADADDGGPLMTTGGIQVGVFTDGYKQADNCYDPRVPQIFTNTAYWREFILTHAPEAQFVGHNSNSG